MTEIQEVTENCISEELSAILSRLTTDQIRFVVARQDCSTDKEAAEGLDLTLSTVYHWPKDVKLAVNRMAQDGLVAATYIRRKNLAKAMLVKASGLDSNDERIRQGVASEIIEWEMGKATQRQEVTGAEGEPVR